MEEEYGFLPSIVTSIVCESAFTVPGVFPVIEKLVPESKKELEQGTLKSGDANQ